ncbi:MAG: hypothetical protein Q7T07_18035 [Burkholderiaceae bacterium]|nr:hypothetical protein [Burkholderiaceae bacterium]
MHAKEIIRNAVARVDQLRQTAAATLGLASAVTEIKEFQARRFTGTYFDLLQTQQYKAATLFFLEELYSEKDYSDRDAQFSRIAGTLERLFPTQVVQTAVALAQLHSLTEDLDLAMAQCWLTNKDPNPVTRYITAWRTVGRRADRNTQLTGALSVGQELVVLTRTPGLRMALKLMRRPASLAGMAALQHFLESGFDTFAAMGNKSDGTDFFLSTVKKRESALIDTLFDADTPSCEAEIAQILQKMA